MLYPRPSERALREWQGIVNTLHEQLGYERVVLRIVYPTTLEVLCASPEDAPVTPGTRDHRDGSQLCEEVLSRRDLLVIPNTSEEAQWDASRERGAGQHTFIGAPLSWPDGELFGSLEAVAREPTDSADCSRAGRLLASMAASVNLRLELLYRDEQAHFDATHDALTGLANRRMFEELTEYHIERTRRSGGELWMLLWQIDDFLNISNRLGAHSAETVLRAAAERARGCIRRSDVMARVDDNEFAVLISEANEFVASAVTDRIRRNVHRIQPFADNNETLTLSCGVSPFENREHLSDWRERTEAALRTANDEGGDRTVVLHPEVGE